MGRGGQGPAHVQVKESDFLAKNRNVCFPPDGHALTWAPARQVMHHSYVGDRVITCPGPKQGEQERARPPWRREMT